MSDKPRLQIENLGVDTVSYGIGKELLSALVEMFYD